MKTVTVIGTGYVGLVTGASLAKIGHSVTCLDIDQTKIELLKEGTIPFYEPGLKELVLSELKAKRLSFSANYSEAIRGRDFCFLALPTPSREDESCNTDYVIDAAQTAAAFIDNGTVLVVKSTVPTGTCDFLRQAVQEVLDRHGRSISFDIVSNPEFLREGTAVEDCLRPDRILLGVENSRSEQLMRTLYAPYNSQILTMDIPSSELSKYASNVMLASRISLMNDLACLCEQLGADIDAVRAAMGTDPRIGPHYLGAGLGFGGSCLPKDVKALRSIAKKNGHSSHFFDSILATNQEQRERFFHKITDYYGTLSSKTLCLWGLAFKPNTDDLREAPSLYLIEKLLAEGTNVQIYDPVAMPKAKKLLQNHSQLRYYDSPQSAAKGADGLILITEWDIFKELDLASIGLEMRHKVLFDGRNQYCPQEMQQLDFDYICVGKSSSYSLASV